MHDANSCSVYRYYDRSGVLIYVGVTSRGIARNREHNRSRPWWSYVTRQEVDHLPDRPAALARERELIERYWPPFNTQHNPHAATIRDEYERHGARPAAAESVRRQVRNSLPLVADDRRFLTTPGTFGLSRLCELDSPVRVIDADSCVVVGRVTELELLPARIALLGTLRGTYVPTEAVASIKTVMRKASSGGPRYLITRLMVRTSTGSAVSR
jgi:hypothetical protein